MDDFNARQERLKNALNQINALMGDLKRQTNIGDKVVNIKENVIKVNFPNNFTEEGQAMEESILDALVDDLNAQAESENECATSTESSHAEFLSSFYYGDADKGEITENIKTEVFDSVDDDDEEIVDLTMEYLESLDSKELFDLLEPLVTLSVEGIHLIHNEILSCTIGEVEFELDSALQERLEALNADDLESIKRRLDFHLSDSLGGYIDCNYERFVLSITHHEDLIRAVSVHALAKKGAK